MVTVAGVKGTLTYLARLSDISPAAAQAQLTSALRGRLRNLLEPAIAVALETVGPIDEALTAVLSEEPDPLMAETLLELIEPSYESLTLTRRWAFQTALNNLEADAAPAARGLAAQLAVAYAGEQQTAGENEKAIELLNKALSLDPELHNEPELTMTMAHALFDLGRFAEAETQAERTCELRADDDEEFINFIFARQLLAATVQRTGDLERARHIFRVAADDLADYLTAATLEFPEGVQMLGTVGVLRLQADDPQAAIEPLEAAVDGLRELATEYPGQFNGILANELFQLSEAYGRVRRVDVSIQTLEEAILLQQSVANDGAVRSLAELEIMVDSLEELVEWTGPNRASTFVKAGEIS